MSKAITFKRTKAIELARKYQYRTQQAKAEAESYALSEHNATTEQSQQYYKEMKEQYRTKYHSYHTFVADLRYEFSIEDHELEGWGQGERD